MVSDETIREAILGVLHYAHRNPKGKFRNVSFSTLYREVKDKVSCNREEVLREARYLEEKKLIKEKKEYQKSYNYRGTKIPGRHNIHYYLTGKAIDQFEKPSNFATKGYMMTRHKVRILSKSNNFKSKQEYQGDFQPDTCFLPIDANVNEGDKIQLIIDDEVKDEKTVGEVKRYFGTPLEHIEVKWWKSEKVSPQTKVEISDSSFYAPFAIGTGNVVFSFNEQSDTEKIVEIIKEKKGIDDKTRNELIEVVETELPLILEKPDQNKSKKLIQKVNRFGQNWLTPILTQLIATYFQHKLGINQ